MAKKKIEKKDNLIYILAGIIFLVSFIFFAKSIQNEYALDDGIVIEKNEFVHQGFGGIKDIMTKDAYASFYKQLGSEGQLSGGRYRPLSIVTFAIEYEWFGLKPGQTISFTGLDGKQYKGKITKVAPGGEITYNYVGAGGTPEVGVIGFTFTNEFKKFAHTQHFVNVLFYAISMVLLFFFLAKVLFRKLDQSLWWSFFATILFAMHPIHSEVVANIKSRDEILSLLFILATLIQYFKYQEKPDIKNGVLTAIWFFLAMLSKEYGAVLLIIIPIWTYVQQKKINFGKMFTNVAPMVIAFIPYFLLRMGTGMGKAAAKAKADVLNDPYMFATPVQKLATEIYILIKYFWLQIIPYPLVSDYSYNTIAYRSFSSPEVWLSIVVNLAIIGATLYCIYKRNWILSFAGLFYLLNLALVSNLIFNIGATMGERLVYNSSLGIIIALVYGLYKLTRRWKESKTPIYIAGLFCAVVAVPFFVINQDRCAAWKSDYTLATTDVKVNSNSALLNANAGAYTLNRSEEFAYKDQAIEMAREAEGYILKALEVHPVMTNGWINLFVVEFKLEKYPEAEHALFMVQETFPSHPNLPRLRAMLGRKYIDMGFQKSQEKDINGMFEYLYKAAVVDPYNPESFYNLGGAYFSVNNLDSAEVYFRKTLTLQPDHPQANQGLGAVLQQKGK